MTRPREWPSGPALTAKTQLMPTFLIIGATKGGTTSLYNYLRQHPDVYMPDMVKEPRFFVVGDREVVRENGPEGWRPGGHVTTLAEYQALFHGATTRRARGEASPQYLYYPDVPGRIRAYIPDVELIVILRDPVARAYSAFLHQTRDGVEPCSDFAAALQDEPRRIQEGWSPLYHYRAQGFYYEQLSRYYRLFPSENIHAYLYDDLRRDPLGLVQNMFGALGVDRTFRPSTEVQHNVSGVPKSRRLHHMYMFLKGSNRSGVKSFGKRLLPRTLRATLRENAVQQLQKNLVKPSLDPDVRVMLREGFRADILKLQELIGRDLSRWQGEA